MEILESSEHYLQWDRNLGDLSEPCDNDDDVYNAHFTDLLCDLSQEALLDQLLSDPFLSSRSEAMDCDQDLSPICSPHPHIQTEHSYSLSGESQSQSPFYHKTTEKTSEPVESDSEDWPVDMKVERLELKSEPLLCDSTSLLPTLTLTLTAEAVTTAALSHTLQEDEGSSPQMKLKPHEVDQFLNLSAKGLEALQMPPTPPSSYGSDTEGSQSPVHSCALASPLQNPVVLKVAPHSPASLPSSLSNSPLLTAPHKLQGSGPLSLTEEERRTLIAEGYPVPTKLPLSKSEEKALKKIRRKIKNKISAQESRRKKKEYMDALEKRVETCSNENNELRRKVETLENTNKSLLQQLHSLQTMVAGKLPRSCRMASTQTSTCIMVIVLCFAVLLGSFYQGLNPCSSITKAALSQGLTIQESYTATVKSRNLLAVKEYEAGEESRPSGLGGRYPERSTQTTVMAMWRLEQQYKEAQVTEPDGPFVQNNRTSTQKLLLIDLHGHRSLKLQSNKSRPKVIELEGAVNEPS